MSIVCSKHSRTAQICTTMFYINLPDSPNIYVYVCTKDTCIHMYNLLQIAKCLQISSSVGPVLLKTHVPKEAFGFIMAILLYTPNMRCLHLIMGKVAQSFCLFSMFKVSQSKYWFPFIVKYVMIADCKNFIMEIFFQCTTNNLHLRNE